MSLLLKAYDIKEGEKFQMHGPWVIVTPDCEQRILFATATIEPLDLIRVECRIKTRESATGWKSFGAEMDELMEVGSFLNFIEKFHLSSNLRQ